MTDDQVRQMIRLLRVTAFSAAMAFLLLAAILGLMVDVVQYH